MTRAEIYAQIDPIFRELFDLFEGPLTDELTAHDVEQWDSLGNVQLVVAIEQMFGLRFEQLEIAQLPNLGALADLVIAKTEG
ncbi:MAG: acyl carrier protein [Pseudomonadota bacterium]